MSAENVWNCVCSYRNDSAKQIEKKYGYNRQKIIDTLEFYQGKLLYHGHQSGVNGEGTNQGADENQNNAVEYLNSHVPVDVSTPTPIKSAPNQFLKNKSIAKTDQLLAIIEEGGGFDTIRQKLNLIDSKWEDNKSVWNEFSRVFFEKKKKKPAKLNT